MSFVVEAPASSLTNAAEPPAEKQSDAELPEFVGFDCRVCSARLFGYLHQVGQPLKCGECGAANVIPPPPKPKPKNIPAAMEGEQYELWEHDAQPLPSEIKAAQPEYVSVECTRCGTLMHAPESQVGQRIPCPDCKTWNVVPLRKKPVAKKRVLAPDAPGLDPRHEPAARPMIIAPTRQMVHEAELEDEYSRALEKSKRTGKPMEIDVRGRPIMPRQPLITGVLPFLVSAGIPIIWVGISAALTGATWLLLTGIAMSEGMGAFLGLWLMAGGAAGILASAAAGSGVVIQIIMESSEGNRRIHQWPHPMDMFGHLLYTVTGGMLSALPGWAIAQIPPLNSDPRIVALLTATSVLIVWPIVLLSQLDINSPWGILSGRIMKSIPKCPFSWALFYFECLLIAAACGGITLLIQRYKPSAQLGVLPVFVFALILWARLLGRLAWILAEKLSVMEPRDITPKYYER